MTTQISGISLILITILSFIFNIFSFKAYAEPDLLAGIRANEPAMKDLSQRLNTPLLARKTDEYKNGNTNVRLLQDVRDKEIDLYLPLAMDSDGLMEALLTIYTLKKNLAFQVRVHFEADSLQLQLTDLPEWGTQNIEKFIAVAGADLLVLNGKIRPAKNFKKVFQAKRGLREVLAGINHDELLENISSELKTAPVTQINRAQIENSNVSLVAPSPQPVNQNFFRMLFFMQKLQRLGAASIELISSYLPYARSDKVDQEGIAVGGKLIALLIEVCGATSIDFVRAHAPQSVGFFNIPTRNISGRQTINHYLKALNIGAIISPDAGFQKDATLYADALGLQVAVINKQRNPITSETEIIGISENHLEGLNVAIVDDETDTGGSSGSAANFLKTLGVNEVYVIVTHLTGNALKALNNPNVKNVIVTNTLPIPFTHPKLIVLNIAPELVANIIPQSTPSDETPRMCQQLFL